MLVKFEQNQMIQNTQNFELFGKKLVYHVNFRHIVVAILKEVSVSETIK